MQRQGNRATTKTGKARTVAISESLSATFAEYLAQMDSEGRTADDSFIWRGVGRGAQRGDPNKAYNPAAMWRFMNRLFHRAGLVDAAGKPIASPHGLRATGATLAAEAGVPLHVISNQLGHASQRMTEDHYIGAAHDLRSYAAQFA